MDNEREMLLATCLRSAKAVTFLSDLPEVIKKPCNVALFFPNPVVLELIADRAGKLLSDASGLPVLYNRVGQYIILSEGRSLRLFVIDRDRSQKLRGMRFTHYYPPDLDMETY